MKKIKNPYLGLQEQGYNCFACCPSNPYGLKMEFFEDGVSGLLERLVGVVS